MHNLIQAADATGVAENPRRQLRSIDLTLGVQNVPPELRHERRVCRAAAADRLMPEVIGIQQRRALLAKYGGDGALAARESAGQANKQHYTFRLSFAAFTVLAINIAIVNGPTPPG